MLEINKTRAEQLLKSFYSEEDLIQKGQQSLDLLEKGGKKAVIGETRAFGGRQYIKTATGWKFHGKGTSANAKAHKAAAGEHHLNNALEDAAAKHDHSNKEFEDAPEGHKHEVGAAVKVHNGITDPQGKQGQTGTVVHSDDEKVNVRFPDGNLGSYQHNTLKRVKSEQISNTGEDYARKAKERYSSKIIEAFKKHRDYSATLREDRYENQPNQNRHSTILFNKFIAACEAEGVDVMQAGAILGHGSDYL
jgi:hypothetical protein